MNPNGMGFICAWDRDWLVVRVCGDWSEQAVVDVEKFLSHVRGRHVRVNLDHIGFGRDQAREAVVAYGSTFERQGRILTVEATR